MPAEPAVVFLGAGSAFIPRLVTDLFNIEGLERGEVRLVDVDAGRLELSRRLVELLGAKLGRPGWSVSATADREAALPGAAYVVNTIEVAGLANVAPDYEIPLKYGVDQCIGDTIGPGGIMKALRTAGDWLAIVADVRRLCPEAVLVNYTNPMSILTRLAHRAGAPGCLGLCHSVQGTSRRLARVLQVPYGEMEWRCAGVNHLAWFTVLRHRGEDLYPRLRELAGDPEIWADDPVRLEVMKELGWYVTESSGHFSEYVPWFRRTPELIARYCRAGYRGESGFYARNWPRWRREQDEKRRRIIAGEEEPKLERGHEYLADIIEARALGREAAIHASVPNQGLIPNLPAGRTVEVEVEIAGDRIAPRPFGPLPEAPAALCRAHLAVYELCADGILGRDREAVIRALMLDPLTAAVLAPADIRRLAGELFAAERAHLPAWLF